MYISSSLLKTLIIDTCIETLFRSISNNLIPNSISNMKVGDYFPKIYIGSGHELITFVNALVLMVSHKMNVVTLRGEAVEWVGKKVGKKECKEVTCSFYISSLGLE